MNIFLIISKLKINTRLEKSLGLIWTFLLKRTNEIQYISNSFNCGLISICSGFESFVVDLGYIFMTGLTDYFCIGKVFFIFEGLIWPGILALMFPENICFLGHHSDFVRFPLVFLGFSPKPV